MTFWYGSGSSDPYLWLTNPDADPGGPKTYGSYGYGFGSPSLRQTMPRETFLEYFPQRQYLAATVSRILTFYPSGIPDPGVKKAPDLRSWIRNTAYRCRYLIHTWRPPRKDLRAPGPWRWRRRQWPPSCSSPPRAGPGSSGTWTAPRPTPGKKFIRTQNSVADPWNFGAHTNGSGCGSC